MPRTKRTASTRTTGKTSEVIDKNVKKLKDSEVRSAVKMYETVMKTEIQKIDNEELLTLQMIDSTFLDITMKYNKIGNKTIEEVEIFGIENLLNETTTSMITTSSMKATRTLRSSSACNVGSSMTTSTAIKSKKKRSSSTSMDEGYRTTGSNKSEGSRPSRLRSAQKTTVKTRKSRSLSRTNNFVTPANKQPPQTFGFVTPKVKPNTPQVILRRPKDGEMAISMQGSPLLVNSVVTNDPNVNIPLSDGRMYSIQAQQGLRKSHLPPVDEDMRQRLEVLRDNLIKMCEYTKH